jgi:hypothetical protein
VQCMLGASTDRGWRRRPQGPAGRLAPCRRRPPVDRRGGRAMHRVRVATVQRYGRQSRHSRQQCAVQRRQQRAEGEWRAGLARAPGPSRPRLAQRESEHGRAASSWCVGLGRLSQTSPSPHPDTTPPLLAAAASRLRVRSIVPRRASLPELCASPAPSRALRRRARLQPRAPVRSACLPTTVCAPCQPRVHLNTSTTTTPRRTARPAAMNHYPPRIGPPAGAPSQRLNELLDQIRAEFETESNRSVDYEGQSEYPRSIP